MDTKLKCSRTKKCGWEGPESDLFQVVSKILSKKHGVEVKEGTCPKCGCKTFYPIEKQE